MNLGKQLTGAVGDLNPENLTTTNEDETNETNEETQPADEQDSQVWVEYSCHPIQRLGLGRFEFEKGMLRLKPEDAEEFDKLLAQQTERQQAGVKKLMDEKAKAEAIAKSHLGGVKRTVGVDTSTSGQKGVA